MWLGTQSFQNKTSLKLSKLSAKLNKTSNKNK